MSDPKKPIIISLLNQKGGSGKTTISTNLAHGLILRGYKTLLVDGDPQGSARDWNEENEANLVPTIGMDRETLPKDLNNIKAGYEIIIIDGAPQIARLTVAAICISDVVLIPVQPSPYDVWAAADTVELIKARQALAIGKPEAAFIISRVIKNTNLNKEVNEPLVEYGLDVLQSRTSQYVLYPESASKGNSIFCYGENQAAREFNTLIEEIIARYIPINVRRA